jgi:acyl carrier protein
VILNTLVMGAVLNDVSTPEALEMLGEVSGIADIDQQTEFGKLSLDSLMLIEWVSLLEEKLNLEFNIRDLDITELGTLSIGDVLDVLRDRVVTAI